MNDAVMEGNLLHQFETIMSFFTRNLKNVQVEKEFNSLGELEIPYVSLMEFVVNALVHRSLNWKAPNINIDELLLIWYCQYMIICKTDYLIYSRKRGFHCTVYSI